MADGWLRCGEQLTQMEENSVLNQTSSCKSCTEYKRILEELTRELHSAKKIIQLLQEDVNMSRTIARLLYQDPLVKTILH